MEMFTWQLRSEGRLDHFGGKTSVVHGSLTISKQQPAISQEGNFNKNFRVLSDFFRAFDPSSIVNFQAIRKMWLPSRLFPILSVTSNKQDNLCTPPLHWTQLFFAMNMRENPEFPMSNIGTSDHPLGLSLPPGSWLRPIRQFGHGFGGGDFQYGQFGE